MKNLLISTAMLPQLAGGSSPGFARGSHFKTDESAAHQNRRYTSKTTHDHYSKLK